MSKSLRHGARQETKALVRLELSPLWDLADAAIAAQWVGGPEKWADFDGDAVEQAWSIAYQAAQCFVGITSKDVMKAAGWAV